MTTTSLPFSTDLVSVCNYDNANRLTAIDHLNGGMTLAPASPTLDSGCMGFGGGFPP